jgi:hypothetical protein
MNAKRNKKTGEEHRQDVLEQAEEEAPEAEAEKPGDKPRHMTPGFGWTRGKDIEDTGSPKKAPAQTDTDLDRSGEKKYEHAAKRFARKH